MEARDIEKLKRDFLTWLFRHVVILSGSYYYLDKSAQPIGNSLPFTYSAFVMSFRDIWFLVTAGHVIKELDACVTDTRIFIEGISLVDFLGIDPADRHTIPFDYASSIRYGVDDEEAGLDFGFVLLPDLYRRLLEMNITPLTEEHWWRYPDEDQWVGYLMLGIPKAAVIPRASIGLMGESFVGTASTAVLALRKLDKAPDWSNKTTLPRFVAEILNPGDLTSIEGMSGGPILGFFDEQGRRHYRIIAIQSRQDKKNKSVIYGSPIRSIARTMLDRIDRHLKGKSD